MRCFNNVKVYIEGEGITRTSISFADRTAVIGCASGDAIDLPSGAVVLPAFIDEHVHGAAGFDAMDGGDAACKISDALAKEGTAYFLATTMTAGESDLIKAIEGVRACMEKDGGILGVHLEGPFISETKVGAQDFRLVKKPDPDMFDRLFEAAGGKVKMITLAPEVEGAEALIKRAVDRGTKVSLGHTDATYASVMRAVECGAGCVTHTFNAQRGLHHREIGTAGAALLCDGLYAELIADTVHVSVPALMLAIKAKPHDKIILITDAMRAKGLKDGVSELGGQTVYVKDGEARLEDGTLAGSVLKMNVAVKNTVEKAGVPLECACDFASANPAKNLGLYDELGGISIGKRASYTVLDEKFDVVMTIRDGKTVYSRR